ncbi:NAD(P)-dependent alcohol dehydrogenase [Pontibacter sp. BT310]|uniref:NAD(P)-dependent alcohol dehydrogenase n=1 Tax=Pontibacter populi TaxID=890055 RepID=A0ABS6X9J6_9BACT|nr:MULTISPECIES: NAD(P)-dependent alcohol dehydrogenase [Pontibacter]MBJ6117825.1 NAD(P)-dependent alcohol dehydrogenase [Pontibacter sp. BT310]MBR0570251.1 NAD(P)-dependent alcohol dehydrogenase [Microvirga sp. STS03]MBW3364677.1 NAD(P)-dependent alcohol dehydrogenase [Pontibacter populi]
MKAAVHTRYGPPEVVSIQEVPKPEPKDNEVLLRVHASTVNRTDSGFRSAEYFISRFWSGLLKPNYQTLGCEFAGQVEAVGRAVKSVKVGEKVFGYNDKKCGGHGQYLTLDENDAFTTIPEGLTYEEAAPITEGAHYALGHIRAAKVTSEHAVLVYGATGAIGSAAVQLLKHFGAHVTAVCHTNHVSLVKSLGADVVIDYTKEDYAQTGRLYSVVFDAVGKTSFGHCKPVLTEKGIYISTELGKNWENIYLALLTPLRKGKKVLFPIPTISKADVEFLKHLVEQKQFKPLLDRIYPLEQIVDAYKYVETGQKIGNVVIILPC